MNNIFKNINGYSLDQEQIEAIVNCNKYNMIIAGAGSGKTLTMIGKIKYLVEIKDIKPEDILCISFTNEAVNSLKNKINNNKIKVFTFHKLAMFILEKENIDYELIQEEYLEEIIDDFFSKAKQNNFLKRQIKKAYKTSLLTPNFIKKNKLYQKNKKIIISFINLYYANNLTKIDLKKILIKKEEPLLFITYAIISYYEDKKRINNYFDFDDLIKEATKACKNKKLNFKEIIIDEFQDTSNLRLNFIKEIITSGDANLTVVGDDFQSIYKFSGCNLNIFLNFERMFPSVKTHKLQTTYRNSNELIKIAGNFVMKNKFQLKKDLKSNKHLKSPLKFIYYINRYKGLIKALKYIKNGEILILGRNNFDIYKFIPKDNIIWKNNGYFILKNYDYNLRYLTIHKSKGLESDNVILINLEDCLLGFPSQKKNNNILKYINSKEDILYEEERRLFYVALTRTKNYCYLLTPYFKQSIFIKEIKKEAIN